MSKPREWWISDYHHANWREVSLWKPSPSDPTREDIHVIEKSAYDALVDKFNELYLCFKTYNDESEVARRIIEKFKEKL